VTESFHSAIAAIVYYETGVDGGIERLAFVGAAVADVF